MLSGRRHRRRWQDNIKIGLKEYEDVDWIQLAQVRVQMQA